MEARGHVSRVALPSGGFPEYDALQFRLFRVLLGMYLTWHFASLLPFAGELFGGHGTLGDARLNPTFGLFPDPLYFLDSDLAVTGFVAGLVVLALLFVLGIRRRLVALVLWFGWASLFNRNNLISNPGIPYIGWILLACALVPSGESGTSDGERWAFPKVLFVGAWVLLALGYGVSGLEKAKSPSWVDGTALVHLMRNPLARDTLFRTWMLGLPLPLLRGLTWLALALELAFAPLALFRVTRPLAWLSIVGMHLGILTVVSFADLTMGMLLFHLFTFDPRWLRPLPVPAGTEPPIVFFDGVCGLCDSVVDLIQQADRQGIFRYSPLQGEAAKRLSEIPRGRNGDYGTVMLFDEGREYQKSDAVLKILSRLGGLYRAVSWLHVLPKGIRDVGYDLVARYRYRIFGKKEACRIPTPAERALFID